MKPTAINAISSPADALADVLRDDERATRTALSRAARAGAEHAQGLPGAAVVKHARNIHEVGKLAAVVQGWADGSKGDTTVNIMAENVIVGDV